MPLILKALLLALLLAAVLSQTADDDEVNASYPGYPHTFYSGFLKIDIGDTPKNVHYVFFPSLRDASADPLVLWMTGGPGCSSLLACFHENGPFTFSPQSKTLSINKQTWNSRANLLYMDLPVGVGYSEGDDQKVITDEDLTQDALASLRMFLARFPRYRKSELYLTGHGYAAVYIANIAKAMIDENTSEVVYNDDWNIKGLLMGNPCVGENECYASGAEKHSIYHYEFLYNRGYFTTKMWNQFLGTCTLNYDTAECYTKRVEMDTIFNKTSTSMYNIYSRCYRTINDTFEDNYINTGCEDNVGILTFLNDPNVKKNWNILTDKEWQPCNMNVFREYQGKTHVLDLLPFFITNKLRIWVYSGDLDAFVPMQGTKKWIENLRHSLEMPVKRVWREWWVPGRHKGQDQVGGFIWELRDLTVVSVKGAGFRTAYDQPQAMSEVLSGFLDGTTLPYKNV